MFSTNSFKRFFIAAILLVPVSIVAQQQGMIEFTNKAFKEVAVTNAQGETEYKLIEPGLVLPNDEIIYIITFKNIGDQAVSNIKITDPIPNNSEYKSGSAFGAGTIIEFSVDGGETYAAAEELLVKDATGIERKATAKDYTSIRWTYTEPLQPGKEGTVTFRTTIKSSG